jgi:hypothetical protein
MDSRMTENNLLIFMLINYVKRNMLSAKMAFEIAKYYKAV